MKYTLLATTILLFVVLTQAGCGRSASADRPQLAPVSGVILYRGGPVEGAVVTFHSEGGGRSAFGVTDAKGEFKLTTFEREDGALVGEHRVTILKLQQETPSAAPEDSPEYRPPTGPEKLPTSLLPPQYSSVARSALRASVQPAGQNLFTFTLEG